MNYILEDLIEKTGLDLDASSIDLLQKEGVKCTPKKGIFKSGTGYIFVLNLSKSMPFNFQ